MSTDETLDDSEFGLGSSIWGHDMKRMQYIADRLYNGMGECSAH